MFQNKRGLWIHNTEGVIGHLHEIQSLGFDYILVKTSDGRSPFHHDAAVQICKDAKSIGMPVAAWHYARPNDIPSQINNVVASLPAGVTDLVLDAEIEWENLGATTAGWNAMVKDGGLVDQLTHGIAEATGHRVTLHLSSFWSPTLHPKMPIKQFMKHCESWQPQIYLEPGGRRTPQHLLTQAIAEGQSIINLAAGQYIIPTINDTRLATRLFDYGYSKSFNVYAWDDDGDARVSTHKSTWALALK